jgi:pimeloyl-ACP methyl ester carboxylesterase
MPTKNPCFLLIHGAWHGAMVWRHLIPLLEARGYFVRAYDLPGAGENVKAAAWNQEQTHDAATSSVDPSRAADVTQAERTQAAVAWAEQMHREAGQPVIVVGHSLGGVTVTALAQLRPDLVKSVVYLCAYMVPPNVSPGAIRQHPTMNGSLVGALCDADALSAGVLRIAVQNPEPIYRNLIRRAFYGDIDDTGFENELALLHNDEPLAVLTTPTTMTRERFGTVPRHYIRTLHDHSLMIAAQDHLISAVDDAMGNRTTVYALSSGHSPHVTDAAVLADQLSIVAESV